MVWCTLCGVVRCSALLCGVVWCPPPPHTLPDGPLAPQDSADQLGSDLLSRASRGTVVCKPLACPPLQRFVCSSVTLYLCAIH